MKENHLRLFIAVPLPPLLKEEIGKVLDRLRQGAGGVRWVRAENVHITLKFLGNVPGERVREVAQAMRRAAEGHAPFEIEIRGAGGFPTDRSPRVLWIGIGDERGGLFELYRDLQKELSPLGFPPEEREFRPHLTLGRVKADKDKRRVSLLLEEIKGREFGRMEVKELILYESRLKPSGAEYHDLERAALGGSNPH